MHGPDSSPLLAANDEWMNEWMNEHITIPIMKSISVIWVKGICMKVMIIYIYIYIYIYGVYVCVYNYIHIPNIIKYSHKLRAYKCSVRDINLRQWTRDVLSRDYV